MNPPSPPKRRLSGEPPVLPARVWALAAVLVAGLLLAAELALRSERLWQLPLEWIATHEFDTGIRAVQRAKTAPAENPSNRTPGTVMILGNSAAIAVMELPWYTPDGSFERPPIAGAREILDLSVNASCYAEQLLLAEQALGSRPAPALAVLFTWPYCLGEQSGEGRDAALHARRVPLTSEWLNDATPAGLADRVERAWVTHTAIGRYRNYVNAWLRSRAGAIADGRLSLRLPQVPTDRSKPFDRPWNSDPIRFARIQGPKAYRVEFGGPSQTELELLLVRLAAAGSKVLLVEPPWSPPIAEALAPQRAHYRAEMSAIAARHGARYVDPSERLESLGQPGQPEPAPLAPDPGWDFNDLLHASHAGGKRYFEAVRAEIESELR